jgi:hypothetical protein
MDLATIIKTSKVVGRKLRAFKHTLDYVDERTTTRYFRTRGYLKRFTKSRLSLEQYIRSLPDRAIEEMVSSLRNSESLCFIDQWMTEFRSVHADRRLAVELGADYPIKRKDTYRIMLYKYLDMKYARQVRVCS